MAEQNLNDPNVGAGFRQVGGEAVDVCVDGDAHADSGRPRRRSTGGIQHIGLHGRA